MRQVLLILSGTPRQSLIPLWSARREWAIRPDNIPQYFVCPPSPVSFPPAHAVSPRPQISWEEIDEIE